MSFLSKLFDFVPPQERDGIHLVDEAPWQVAPTRDVERFLRALPVLFPTGATAYFEGTGEAHVEAYLREVSVPPQVKVAIGTIWPTPDVYHVPLTPTAMDAMAAFLGRRPAGYFCAHCHVYRDGIVLLEWHDAFGDDPLHVSGKIGEGAVKEFAEALGASYTLATSN